MTNGNVARSVAEEIDELLKLGRDCEAAALGAASVGNEPALNPRTGEPMHPLDQLAQLAPMLGNVFASVTPADLDRPTPCGDFTVRGVLEHMAGGATAFAAAFRGRAGNPPVPEGDIVSVVGDALGELASAMNEPGALDRTIAAPFGEVPGETFARFVVLDGLVHGWDLSHALGLPYDPPAALVDAVTGFAEHAIDPLRDGETFAAAVAPPAGASPIQRLAAYTGRRVGG